MSTIHLRTGLRPVDELQGELGPGDIILEKGDVSSLDLPHLLSVRVELGTGDGGLSSGVLWLDGGNSFNPYRVSRMARSLDLDPEESLKDIYISRAFTCYQMSSLVLERLWGALEEYEAKLIVVTDLPSLFIHSDIPRGEAGRAFEPVVEELRKFRGREEVLLLTSESLNGRADGEILPKLESTAEIVLDVRDRRGGVNIELEKHPSKTPQGTVLGTENRGMSPLERYAGGD